VILFEKWKETKKIGMWEAGSQYLIVLDRGES
jgi:hypothetical protein